MQIPLLHQQILLQTERLRDLHRSLMMHSSPVPAAEMNTLLQEIRNLYSLALQLNTENDLQLFNEVQIAIKNITPLPSPKPEEKIIPESAPLAEVQVKETEVKEPIVNTNSQSSFEIRQEENTPEKKRLVSDIHEMFQDAPTLANRFSDHKTIGESIAGNVSLKRVSENLKTPVRDIKSAIGLNEKFLFINQLFNGDSKKYNATVDELNASTTAEAALNSVKEISDINNWESHASAAKMFIDIVERRFA